MIGLKILSLLSQGSLQCPCCNASCKEIKTCPSCKRQVCDMCSSVDGKDCMVCGFVDLAFDTKSKANNMFEAIKENLDDPSTRD